jgi:antirestriction protein
MSDYINDSINIRVYVECLSSYSNGYHYGKWIDLEKDCPTINSCYEKIKEILKNSPADDAEEWEIIETMGLGRGDYSGDIKTIYKVLEIKKNCEDINVFDAAMNLVDEGIAHIDNLPSWIDSFVGFYDSEIDFAEQIFNDCEQCPDHLEPYIDIELYARDLFHDYEYCKKTGAVFAR